MRNAASRNRRSNWALFSFTSIPPKDLIRLTSITKHCDTKMTLLENNDRRYKKGDIRMGKSNSCARNGLFLWLDKLCRHVAESIKGMKNKPMMNTSAYAWLRTGLPKKELYIKDTDGKRISQSEYTCLYDLSALREVGENAYTLSGRANRQQAINDIMNIVGGLNKARKICPDMPFILTNVAALKFDYVEQDFNLGKIVTLHFRPKTPTRRMPLLQYDIQYHFSDDFFGSVSYSKDGVNRGNIILWIRKRAGVLTHANINHICWDINVRKSSAGEITIHSIDKHLNNDRISVYRARKLS